MRSVPLLVAALTFALSASAPASGCTCAGDQPIEQAFAKASEVFLAQAVYVTHLAVPEDPDHGWSYVELAAFRVMEVWKGSPKAGDIIQALGWYGAGGCGRSVAESPRKPFSPGEQSRAVSYRRPGSWIIYRFGSEPYRLSACSRTRPLDKGGDDESALLRQLSRAERARP